MPVGVTFESLVRVADFGVEVLDGRWQITRQYLAGFVEQRLDGNAVGVEMSAEIQVGNVGKRMRKHRNLLAVFHDVFGKGVAHKAPAVDILHAVEIGEKLVH